MKDLYIENHKTLMKKVKEDTDGEIYCVHGLEIQYCENGYTTQSNL